MLWQYKLDLIYTYMTYVKQTEIVRKKLNQGTKKYKQRRFRFADVNFFIILGQTGRE